MDITRVKLQLKKPNPLFEGWVEEIYLSAVAEGSKSQEKLKLALESLKLYPLSLKSGKECAILKGFGKTLCEILDRKLNSYQSVFDSLPNLSKRPPENSSAFANEKKSKSDDAVRKCNKNQVSSYVPSYRSGAYAILVAIFKTSQQDDYQGYMTKAEIQKDAQKYCDESLTKPKPNTFYSAWSSMKILISKGLVTKEAKIPARFLLSESGRVLAEKLLECSQNYDSGENINSDKINKFHEKKSAVEILNLDNVVQPSSIVNKFSNVASFNEFSNDNENNKQDGVEPSILFPPDTFDIYLLVDKQETSGASKKDDATINELNKYKMIKYELRHLKIGDFAWVARSQKSNQELILPYILERKRIDDLSKSIKDGRFHEQKFRLKQCGVPNIMYLVESYGDNRTTGLPMSTLMQAVSNTMIQDHFMTHFTSSLAHSIKFLAMMTVNLSDNYRSKTLLCSTKEKFETGTKYDNPAMLVEFNNFNLLASKTRILTIKDMFIKQLLQLSGVSVEKAVAIVSEYGTPHNLVEAFNASTKPELTLTKLHCGNYKCSISTGISKTIYQYFSSIKLM